METVILELVAQAEAVAHPAQAEQPEMAPRIPALVVAVVCQERADQVVQV